MEKPKDSQTESSVPHNIGRIILYITIIGLIFYTGMKTKTIITQKHQIANLELKVLKLESAMEISKIDRELLEIQISFLEKLIWEKPKKKISPSRPTRDLKNRDI